MVSKAKFEACKQMLLEYASQENFFGHMKDELDFSSCNSYDEVKATIDDWIDYYNKDRYQWDVAKLFPNEFYNYAITGNYPLPTGISKAK